MPLDPAIILGGRPAPIAAPPSPFEVAKTLSTIEDVRAQVEQRRLAADKARQDAADRAAVQQSFQEAGDDIPKAISLIRQRAPLLAGPIEKQWQDNVKSAAESKKLDLEVQGLQLNHNLQLAQFVVDQPTWDRFLPVVAKQDPNMAAALGPTYDPQKLERLNTALLTAEQRNQAHQAATKLWLGDKPQESLYTAISAIDPTSPTAADEQAQILKTYRAMGTPEPILASVGDFSPENHARITRAAIGPTKLAELNKPQAPTEGALDAEAQRILAKDPATRTPAEVANLKAYQTRKTMVTDTAATYAAVRQASAQEQQNALQGRAQAFTEAQAGRKELQDKVETPYLTSQASSNTLRDVVAAAQAGNKVAGSLQSLETTMAAIRAQGLNRINMPEIASTAQAGSTWDRIVGWYGKKVDGQPIPPNIQKDMLAFADILDKAAYAKYKAGHEATTKRYGLTEAPLPAPGGAATTTTPGVKVLSITPVP